MSPEKLLIYSSPESRNWSIRGRGGRVRLCLRHGSSEKSHRKGRNKVRERKRQERKGSLSCLKFVFLHVWYNVRQHRAPLWLSR